MLSSHLNHTSTTSKVLNHISPSPSQSIHLHTIGQVISTAPHCRLSSAGRLPPPPPLAYECVEAPIYQMESQITSIWSFHIGFRSPSLLSFGRWWWRHLVISGRVFLVVETADLTNKVPSSLAISVVSSAAVVVAAFLRSLVLQPHLHHVGAASSACVRPVRNNDLW